MPPGSNKASFEIIANAPQAEQTIQRLNGMIEQLKQNAASIQIGGPGSGVRLGGGMAGGVSGPAASMVSASTRPSVGVPAMPGPSFDPRLGGTGFRSPITGRILGPAATAAMLSASVSPGVPVFFEGGGIPMPPLARGAAAMAAAAGGSWGGGFIPPTAGGGGYVPGPPGGGGGPVPPGMAGPLANAANPAGTPPIPAGYPALGVPRVALGLARGVMVATGSAGAEYFRSLTHEEMTGTVDLVGKARAEAMLKWGLVGAVIGAPMGFWGSTIGASVVGGFGASITEFNTAPILARQQAMRSMGSWTFLQGGTVNPVMAERLLRTWQGGQAYVGPGLPFFPLGIPVGHEGGIQNSLPNLESVSANDALSAYGAIRTGFLLSSGRQPKNKDVMALWQSLYAAYGPAGTDAAKLFGRALTGFTSAGNFFDLALREGPEASRFLMDLTATPGGDDLIAGYVQYQGRADRLKIAGQVSARGQSELQTLRLGGLSARASLPYVRSRSRDVQSEIGVVDEMLGIIEKSGGKGGLEYETQRARRASLVLEQRQLFAGYGQERFGEVQGRYAYDTSQIGVDSSRARLYGSPSDVRGTAQREIGAIDRNIRELVSLRDELKKEGALSVPMRLQIDTLVQQQRARKVEIPAQVAEFGVQVTQQGQTLRMAESQYGLTSAKLFGDDATLNQAFGKLKDTIQKNISEIAKILGDPQVPETTRRGLRPLIPQMQSDIVQAGAEQRLTLLRRGDLAFDVGTAGRHTQLLQSSLYGSEADIRTAFGVDRTALIAREAELFRQGHDLSLPVEVRQQRQLDYERVRQQRIQQQATMNQEIMGRISLTSGTAQGAASFGLERAAGIGSAGDLLRAGGTYAGTLQSEDIRLGDLLRDPGLTFEQKQRIYQRRTQLGREAFGIGQEAIDLGFRKVDLEGYDLRQMYLGNARRRMAAMPYGPGNRYAFAMEEIQSDRARILELQGRYRYLQATGNLSPERNYQILSGIEEARTSIAEQAGMIANGEIDRIPGLSAGTPASYFRMTSLQQAALRLNEIGSPVRTYGAINGAQAARQDAFIKQFGMGGFYPVSRTAGINNASMDNGAGLGQVVELLRQLLDAVRSNARLQSTRNDYGPADFAGRNTPAYVNGGN